MKLNCDPDLGRSPRCPVYRAEELLPEDGRGGAVDDQVGRRGGGDHETFH